MNYYLFALDREDLVEGLNHGVFELIEKESFYKFTIHQEYRWVWEAKPLQAFKKFSNYEISSVDVELTNKIAIKDMKELQFLSTQLTAIYCNPFWIDFIRNPVKEVREVADLILKDISLNKTSLLQILLIGGGNDGKTCFVDYFRSKDLKSTNLISLHGRETLLHIPTNLGICHLIVHERNKYDHTNYDGVIAMCDASSVESMETAVKNYKESVAERACVVICKNKIDLPNCKNIFVGNEQVFNISVKEKINVEAPLLHILRFHHGSELELI